VSREEEKRSEWNGNRITSAIYKEQRNRKQEREREREGERASKSNSEIIFIGLHYYMNMRSKAPTRGHEKSLGLCKLLLCV
jgi:hypothetical protein